MTIDDHWKSWNWKDSSAGDLLNLIRGIPQGNIADWDCCLDPSSLPDFWRPATCCRAAPRSRPWSWPRRPWRDPWTSSRTAGRGSGSSPLGSRSTLSGGQIRHFEKVLLNQEVSKSHLVVRLRSRLHCVPRQIIESHDVLQHANGLKLGWRWWMVLIATAS